MMGQTMMVKRTLLVLAAIVGAVLLSSTVALAATIGCQTMLECTGTQEPDTLHGTEGNDYMWGAGGADTLNGLLGTDRLYGQSGGDKLYGGDQADYLHGGSDSYSYDFDSLIGGAGNDTLIGGPLADSYYFANGWGQDTITEQDTPSNSDVEQLGRVHFLGGPSEGERVPASEDLTIKLISGGGPEVTNASGTSTINWDSNVIKSVTSGSGDDKIVGNHLPNIINAKAGGTDTISAGAGRDEIHADDGAGDDVVDCGENYLGSDDDKVYHDPGDQIADNCERKYVQ